MDRKKESRVSVAQAEKEFEKSVEDLTSAIVEDLEAGYQSDLEPFEIYANRIRHQVHENLEAFKDRFLHGYDVLIDEIKQLENENRES